MSLKWFYMLSEEKDRRLIDKCVRNSMTDEEVMEFVNQRKKDMIRVKIYKMHCEFENSEIYCDFHAHSNCSDGSLTPTELVELGEKMGLGFVALCDHNSVAGLDEALRASENSGCNVVPGIEFSTEYKGVSLHVVALFILRSSHKKIETFLEKYQKSKQEGNRILAENLSKAGYQLDYDKLLDKTANINRAHFAIELVDKGYCKNKDEAFADILSEDKGYYIPSDKCDILTTLDFIRTIGAFPILAHPLEKLSKEKLDEYLPAFIERGLKGMETDCTCYGEDKRNQARELCRKYNLLESCGTDFHGTAKPDITLGSIKAPLSTYEKMLDILLDETVD